MIDVTHPRTKLIKVDEAAQILGVSPKTVYEWIKHGYRGRKLDVVRVGRTYRTTREAIREFLRVPGKDHGSARADRATDEALSRYGID